MMIARRKLIWGIFIILVSVAGVVWLARPAAENKFGDSSSLSSATAPAALAVSEARFDFGKIAMSAGPVSHIFKVKNTGDDPVVMTKMYTSCMCTTASLTMDGQEFGPVGMPGHTAIPTINQALKPNEEAAIEVVFDPAAHGPAGVGRIERSVYLENNAGGPLELNFTALVEP